MFVDFFNYAVNRMIKNNVNVHLHSHSCNVSKDINSTGSFGESEFNVSTNSKNYEEIFIHEYCHFLQWKNKNSIWYKIDQKDECDFWDFLSGEKKLSEKKIMETSLMIGRLEADCEKKAVQIIKRWEIENIDIDRYKRKANSYIFFYSVIPEVKKWYKSSSPPYYYEEIINTMPSRFLSSYENPPEEYVKLVKKYCI
jgi:hypothetical protein